MVDEGPIAAASGVRPKTTANGSSQPPADALARRLIRQLAEPRESRIRRASWVTAPDDTRSPLTIGGDPSAAPVVRRRVMIGTTERTNPVPPRDDPLVPVQAHENLYGELVQSPRTFRFHAENDLLDFLKDKKERSTTSLEAKNLIDAPSDDDIAEITGVDVAPVVASHTTLRINLTIHRDNAPDTTSIAYTSLKRHLLGSMDIHQYTAIDARPNNSLCTAGLARYSQAFENYIRMQAQVLQRRKMVFGYDPSREPGHEGDIIFGAEPSSWPRTDNTGQLNPIHAYPVRGTKVFAADLRLFEAVKIIRSWYHESDHDTGRKQPTNDYPTVAELPPWAQNERTGAINKWTTFGGSTLPGGADLFSTAFGVNAATLAGRIGDRFPPLSQTPMRVFLKEAGKHLHELRVLRGLVARTAPAQDPGYLAPGTRDVIAKLRLNGAPTRQQLTPFLVGIPAAALNELFTQVANPNVTTAIVGAQGANLNREPLIARLNQAKRATVDARIPVTIPEALQTLHDWAGELIGVHFLPAGTWQMLA
jgi:hypothetical protein